MLIGLTLGCEIGASLILACVNTVVALALIALSLSARDCGFSAGRLRAATGKSSPLLDVGREVYE